MTYQEAYNLAADLVAKFSNLASRIVLDKRDVLYLLPGHERLSSPPRLRGDVFANRDDFEAYIMSREETDYLERYIFQINTRLHSDVEDGCEEENG